MASVWTEEDSVYFVGGRGTKTGDVKAGGCTKEFWGDLTNPNYLLSDVMNTNGEPVSAAAAWNGSGNACTVTQSTAGKVLITKAGAFTDVIAGLVANVDFSAVYFDGRFKVNAAQLTANTIEIEQAWSANVNCDVKVGGAFDKLQTASDETSAMGGYDILILTNKTETFAGAGDEINIDAGGGLSADGSWKRIIGIDDDGVELADGSWITIDVDSFACNGIVIGLGVILDNLEIAHIKGINVPSPKAAFFYDPGGWTHGQVLRGCASEDCYRGALVDSFTMGISIIGGYFQATYRAIETTTAAVYGITIINVHTKVSGNNVCIYTTATGGTFVSGCILESTGTGYGFACDAPNGTVTIVNCVFYKVVDGIVIGAADAVLVEFNNIYIVNEKAVGLFIRRTFGSFAFSDYSCGWAIDGQPVASGRWGGKGIGEHSIELDPLFFDAANGDFRLKMTSPCKRTGKPTLGKL